MDISRRKALIGLGATATVFGLPIGLLPTEAKALAGDGMANDLPAIRSMLAEAEKRGRGTVKLPPGRFLLAPTDGKPAIVVPANVRIEGSGVGNTELVMGDGLHGHVISAPYGWAQIADLTVNGNEAKRQNVVG